jgi:AbrB family looped-hinge helix DNA binding protein
MIKSTVTSKGQTTIPRNIRQKLGISTGDVLLWDASRDSVRVRLASPGFLQRRGTIRIGKGSVTEDLARARATRARETT